MAANAASILAALETEPELFSEVWAISFRSERRWDVYLRNGMEIRLPENDPISAWSRLAVIDWQKAITNRDLAVIDLRVPKQLIVEPNIPVRGQGTRHDFAKDSNNHTATLCRNRHWILKNLWV